MSPLSSIRRRSQVIAAALPAVVAAGVVLAAGPVQATSYDADLKDVRAATARFHSTVQAERAGYQRTPECVSSPAGVMGIHYENAALMKDPALDPLQPEILVYAPNDNGKLKLVAVEYYVEAAAVTAAPSLFGHTFEGPMPAHHPGMVRHYDLHAWVWAANPAGTFALFNPTLSC
jgi:hypothetical protein